MKLEHFLSSLSADGTFANICRVQFKPFLYVCIGMCVSMEILLQKCAPQRNLNNIFNNQNVKSLLYDRPTVQNKNIFNLKPYNLKRWYRTIFKVFFNKIK